MPFGPYQNDVDIETSILLGGTWSVASNFTLGTGQSIDLVLPTLSTSIAVNAFIINTNSAKSETSLFEGTNYIPSSGTTLPAVNRNRQHSGTTLPTSTPESNPTINSDGTLISFKTTYGISGQGNKAGTFTNDQTTIGFVLDKNTNYLTRIVNLDISTREYEIEFILSALR